MKMPEMLGEQELSAGRRGPQSVTGATKGAACLVHDLNNVLTVMLTTSSFLCAEVHPQSPLFNDVNDIIDQARRAASLVQQLSQHLRDQGRQAAA